VYEVQIMKIITFTDKHLYDAEQIIKENDDVFAKDEVLLFRSHLLSYLQHENIEKTCAFVAVEEDILLGVIMAHHVPESQGYFKIEWLAIKKDSQGKGLGTLLIKKCVDTLKDLNARYVIIETAHEKYNKKVENFYIKLGFKLATVLPDFYNPPKNKNKPEDYAIYSMKVN
jgi:GNAT superfamily N-acetyltransferase